MRRILFQLWLLWLVAMTLIFAPVTIALGVIATLIGAFALVWGYLFNVLTLETFR